MANIIKKVKNKVIDVASDIMSAPSRMISTAKMNEANALADDFKTVRMAKGDRSKGEVGDAPDAGNYTDPLFRARANVSNAKTKVEIANKKRGSSDGYIVR